MLTRSAPLLRFTPLRPSTKSLVRSPIRRVSPRARARSRAWAAVCRAVFAACGGRCEARIPGVCTGRAVTCHHVRMRSQARDDTPRNALAVCARCHRHLHDHPADAAARGFILQRKDGAAC